MAGERNKSAFGCRLPPGVAPNTVITDIRGKPWTLGSMLGQGGFGAIYRVQPGDIALVEEETKYVAKVEPHDNGPLFVELHALLRLGRQSSRIGWKPRYEDKAMGWVGVPVYHTHGSFVVNTGVKLRFLIMSRHGSDLETIFQSGMKPLPMAAVLNIGLQVLNSLEYIHHHGYCHNDVKAANILMDETGCDVYLVDFGLACKYRNDEGYHCDGGEDVRKAHEGTLEYCSRDAHRGAHSRRGDLESLGYCMLHWTGAHLPWIHALKEDPECVQAAKETSLANISNFLSSCFHPSPPPSSLLSYWNNVLELKFESQPDYAQLRNILTQALEELGSNPHDKLVFSGKTVEIIQKSSAVPDLVLEKGKKRTRTRSQTKDDDVQSPSSLEFDDPESVMRERRRMYAEEEMYYRNLEKEVDFIRAQKDSLNNPTPEMRRLITLMTSQEMTMQRLNGKEQLAEIQQRKSRWTETRKSGFTPQMEEIIARRAKRQCRNLSPLYSEPSDEEGNTDPSSLEKTVPTLSSKRFMLNTLSKEGKCNETIEAKPNESGRRNHYLPESSSKTPLRQLRNRDKLTCVTSTEPRTRNIITRLSEYKDDCISPGGHNSPYRRSPRHTYTDCVLCGINLAIVSVAQHLRDAHGHRKSISSTPELGKDGFGNKSIN